MTLVRPRTDADLPALVTVLRAVHERDGYPVHWHEPAADWLTPAGMLGAWVAVVGDEPVGHVLLAGEAAGLSVGRLFVAPTARGLRLADLLLDVVEGEAARRGQPLTLQVHIAATAAISRYERRGWRRTGTHTAHWSEADGTPALAHRYVAPRHAAADARTAHG